VNRIIRVGNAQAFWGDRPQAAAELLALRPDLDFLTMDYLAEVTMSILAQQRERDPSTGFPADFVGVVRGLCGYWAAGGRCKLIANAGGLNPLACAGACQKVLAEGGCAHLRIAIVTGDDVLPLLTDSAASPSSFVNLDDGAAIETVRARLVSANAYLGCAGIAKALDEGATLIITGRVADPSMVVGACVHAFGWKHDDWDRLAGATVAGHLLECGTQATGGISTDWLELPENGTIGYPIAEIDSTGHFVLTKPERTGGAVNLNTVKEQLIYEIGDPARYLSPDVAVSFLGIQLKDLGGNRVAVEGARGYPRPNTYKVSATYRDGFRAAGTVTIYGPHALAKARRAGSAVLERLVASGCRYRDALVECLGSGDAVPVWPAPADSLETVLRVAVESPDRSAVESFSREFFALVSAGPQGTTGYAEGRPRVHAVFRYWPCLISVEQIKEQVELLASLDPTPAGSSAPLSPRVAPLGGAHGAAHGSGRAQPSSTLVDPVGGGHSWLVRRPASSGLARPSPPAPRRLFDIALGRSGDKGISANVGIWARRPEDYPALVDWLTAAKVQEVFAPIGLEGVERFEWPALCGMNFLLKGVLRRGLRTDAQGKALAQALLCLPLDGFPEAG